MSTPTTPEEIITETATSNNNNSRITTDRSIGVNFSIPQSLLTKIDEKRGMLSRSAFVREAINKYLESG